MKKNRILLSREEAATIAQRAFLEHLADQPGIWSLLHRHVRPARRRRRTGLASRGARNFM